MRVRWLVFVVLLGAGCAGYWLSPWGRHAESATRQERPFVSLEAVVAGYDGWAVVAPPRLPGPYRKSLAGGSCLGPGGSMICRAQDDDGTVIEEVRLQGDPAYAQLVVSLGTASGGRTLVVMRRPR